jgi:hypothetical protein
VLLEHTLSWLAHLHTNKLESLGLKSFHDFTDEASLNSVWLDHNVGSLLNWDCWSTCHPRSSEPLVFSLFDQIKGGWVIDCGWWLIFLIVDDRSNSTSQDLATSCFRKSVDEKASN